MGGVTEYSQLLPRAADLVRFVTDYFRRCGGLAPILRIKLYSITRHLFVAMGAGLLAGSLQSLSTSLSSVLSALDLV